MAKIKTISLADTRLIVSGIGIGGLILFLPMLIPWQWLTGPLVNALLIISLFLLGSKSTYVLCVMPSLIALFSGFLPIIIAPLLPFIWFGNIIYIFLIGKIYKAKNNSITAYWQGLGVAGIMKYLILYFGLLLITKVFNDFMAVNNKISFMFSWPQLLTALTGGMIAFIFLYWLKRIPS